MALAIPAEVRIAVLAELARQFDAARWEEISQAQASEAYDRFVKDPKIGGRLDVFMPLDKIRVWIKDGPAKEYRRALEGIGPMAPYTNRAYPGPQGVVRLALGDQWSLTMDTLEEKPMRGLARNEEGASRYLIWGPLGSLRDLIWNACLARVTTPGDPITIAITKPGNAPIPSESWSLVTRLGSLIDADCRQVTYLVGRKTQTATS